jgi:hypothetical protein
LRVFYGGRVDKAERTRENDAMETRCTRCDATMSCNPEGDCWCLELPHGPMPALKAGEAEGCLCRSCLEKQLRKDRLEGRRTE